MVVISL
jgi:hypothetical protein